MRICRKNMHLPTNVPTNVPVFPDGKCTPVVYMAIYSNRDLAYNTANTYGFCTWMIVMLTKLIVFCNRFHSALRNANYRKGICISG